MTARAIATVIVWSLVVIAVIGCVLWHRYLTRRYAEAARTANGDRDG